MNDGTLALACTTSAELEPELGALRKALELHGFAVEKSRLGAIGKDGHILLPLLRLKGHEAEAERLSGLLIAFYHDANPVDTTLVVEDDFDDDQTVDDHLEFELEFKGAETLVMLPPEIFSEGMRESILTRYHRELAAFAKFLVDYPAVAAAA